MLNYIKKELGDLVSGRMNLGRAYWLYGVGVGLFFRLIDAWAAGIIMETMGLGITIFAILCCYLAVTYSCLSCVGIFRCAMNYKGNSVFTFLACSAVIAGISKAFNGTPPENKDILIGIAGVWIVNGLIYLIYRGVKYVKNRRIETTHSIVTK